MSDISFHNSGTPEKFHILPRFSKEPRIRAVVMSDQILKLSRFGVTFTAVSGMKFIIDINR